MGPVEDSLIKLGSEGPLEDNTVTKNKPFGK